MGIFDALTTAVSGLSAQSYALQNISGNIANSQTTAFKRINNILRQAAEKGFAVGSPQGATLAPEAAKLHDAATEWGYQVLERCFIDNSVGN